MRSRWGRATETQKHINRAQREQDANEPESFELGSELAAAVAAAEAEASAISNQILSEVHDDE